MYLPARPNIINNFHTIYLCKSYLICNHYYAVVQISSFRYTYTHTHTEGRNGQKSLVYVSPQDLIITILRLRAEVFLLIRIHGSSKHTGSAGRRAAIPMAASLFRQPRVLVMLSRVCVECLERVWAVVIRTNDSDVVRRAVLACHELQRDGCAFQTVNQPLDFERPLSLPDAGGVQSWFRSGTQEARTTTAVWHARAVLLSQTSP